MTAPALRQRLHAGHLILALLAALVLLLAWRLWTAPADAPPAMPPVAPPPLADAVLLAGGDPFFPQIPAETLAVTSLPFTLHGVRTDSASGRGSAIIAGGDGAQQLREVGEALEDGVTLAAVAIDHVVLDHQGQRELLWLDSAGSTDIHSDADAHLPYPEPPPPQGLPATIAPEPGAADMPAAPPETEGYTE